MNHSIPEQLPQYFKEQWNVALNMLQPTASELEKGLAIHYDSLIAEAYSLGLHAPLDKELLNKQIEEGLTPLEYKDLSEEQRMLNWLNSDELKKRYEDTWRQAGVSCLFLNAGEEGNHPLRLIKRMARYVHLIDSMPEVLSKVTTVKQIRAAREQGKRSICLALNGIPLKSEYMDTMDAMQFIRVFVQLGVKVMHLTYNRRNLIGDGCGEPVDGGLSAFGHEVVEELNRLGVIIDLAHTGWKTCLDTCKASRKPVIVSHSTVHALADHIRAKPDEVIRAVVDGGGVFGVTNIPAFLGGRGDLVTFLDHIDYVIRKFGEDGICVGTDKACSPTDIATGKLVNIPKGRPIWEKLWPANDRKNDLAWWKPEQIDSMWWTNWPLFTVGMVQRGHSERTIRKVLGENLMRVAKEVWGE